MTNLLLAVGDINSALSNAKDYSNTTRTNLVPFLGGILLLWCAWSIARAIFAGQGRKGMWITSAVASGIFGAAFLFVGVSSFDNLTQAFGNTVDKIVNGGGVILLQSLLW